MADKIAMTKNWLDPFIKASKVSSQEELADLLDVSRATINRLANDHTKLKRDRAEAMAPLLDVSVNDLMLNRLPGGKSKLIQSFDPDEPEAQTEDHQMTMGSETGVRGVPNDGSPQIDATGGMGGGGLAIVSEGVPGRHGMTFAADNVRDYWRLPPALLVSLGLAAQDVAVLPVQGDSMLPTLNEGDVVFIDTRHRWPSPSGLYAVLDEIGGLVVKRLEISSQPGAQEQIVSVISDNPRHKPKEWRAEDLFIVGRVLRKFGVVN
jgi:transcriptional regulator with XRE-family HTH domain